MSRMEDRDKRQAPLPLASSSEIRNHPWEAYVRSGQLVAVGGWWFRVAGVVPAQEPHGALVLEALGTRLEEASLKERVAAIPLRAVKKAGG